MTSTVVDDQHTHVPPREWTALSARLGAFVDSLIDRKDVIAAIGVAATPIVGGTRPAGVFDQSTGTVTVDAAQTLLPQADPGRIDLRDRRDCAAHPVLAGVVAHESGHAAHTVCRGMQRARTEQWSALLEEPRMEGRIVAGRPSARTWLQASATQIIGTREPTSASSAASMLILLGGRIAAGVFDADDLPDLTALAAEHLTGEQIDVINTQTATAVALTDGDIEGLAACADTIADVMGDDDTDGDDSEATQGGDATGSNSIGDANSTNPTSGSSTTDGSVDSTDSANSDCSTSRGGSTSGDSGDPGPGWVEHDGDDHTPAPTADDGTEDGPVTQALTALAATAATHARLAAGIRTTTRADQRQQHEQQQHAEQVAAAGHDADNARHHGHFTRVTPGLLAQSRHLNRALATASDRGVAVTRHATDAPPGRLHMGRLVRRHGQIAAGVTPTAAPWSHTRRRTIDRPPLVVGIAVDISPSMSPATRPAAEAAWLMQRAAHARRGHAATVTWHSTVAALPASPAGDQMYLPETDGRSGGLPEAIDALDGKLRYAHADGARLLCIVTDSCLPNLETVQRKVTQLHKLGVAVLWVTIPTGEAITTLTHTTHAHADDPDTIGHTIADAAVKALRHA